MSDLRQDDVKSQELVRLTKQRAKEKGLPFTAALLEIGREYVDLVTAARNEVLGMKTTFRQIGGYKVLDIEEPKTVDLGYIARNMARERAKEKDVPFSEALSEIARENPTLIHRYRAQVLGID
jgi:hypothetical protein